MFIINIDKDNYMVNIKKENKSNYICYLEEKVNIIKYIYNVKEKNIKIEKQDSLIGFITSRKQSYTQIERMLGGNDYPRAFEAYKDRGVPQLEDFLSQRDVTGANAANVFTYVAKQIRKQNPVDCAKLAKLAYASDPKPFRLKWLAFRLLDAGERIPAAAIFEILVNEIEFTEKEKQKILNNSSYIVNNFSLTDNNAQAKQSEYISGKKYISNKDFFIIKKINKKLKEQVETEKTKVNELQLKTKKISNQCSEYKQNFQTINSEKNKIIKYSQELETKISKLSNENCLLKEQINSKSQELKKMLEDIQFYNSKLENIDNDKSNILAYISRLETKMIEVEDRLNACTKYIAHSDEISKKNAEIVLQYEKKLKDKINILQEKEKKLLLSEEHNKEIRQQLQNYKNVIESKFDNLIKKLNESDGQNNILSKALSAQFSQISENIEKGRLLIKQDSTRILNNALKRATAFNSLERFFINHGVSDIKFWSGGWPADPDFILEMVKKVYDSDYDLIIEFGSGNSTLFLAKTAKILQTKDGNTKIPKIISFDHLQEYFDKTKKLLKSDALSDEVELIHAPLETFYGMDNVEYPYYSCNQKFAQLKQNYANIKSKILVIVDGPPGNTCKNARYPALPVILSHFAPANIDFILDDYMRHEEKEIGEKWKTFCETAGLNFTFEEKGLEKESLILSISYNYKQ